MPCQAEKFWQRQELQPYFEKDVELQPYFEKDVRANFIS